METTKQLIVLVGPCGSGKSTLAKEYKDLGYEYINQDSQGKEHLNLFDLAILAGKNVIVDRMGFSKQQRERYISLAKTKEYKTKIIVLHESYKTCFDRMMLRQGHETIKDEKSARSALGMFFSKYERVQDVEADEVVRVWPPGPKALAAIFDLDGTLCNCEKRRHFVNKPKGEKKDWAGFFREISEDTLHLWCAEILKAFSYKYSIVLCSGRPDDYRKQTVEWLKKHGIVYENLFMRPRNDSRQDNITKEVILDFEILTRYTPYIMIDDRQQVVDMWRSRGYTCLQCDKGDF